MVFGRTNVVLRLVSNSILEGEVTTYDPATHVFEDTRPDWNEYWLGIAKAVSVRAECVKRQVGAILVTEDNRHRGSGYNGGQKKGPSCLLGQCPRAINNVPAGTSYDTGPGTCIAVHAEQNLMLDTRPEDRQGATIYITDTPCDGCLRMLKASGIYQIIWPNGKWVWGQGLWTEVD